MSSDRTRVAIVGAGIAGTTAARALHRAGVSPVVFERATVFEDSGAGVQLAPNSTRILRRLGYADLLAERGTRAEAIEIRRWSDGTVLATTELGTRCERVHGAPYYLIQRADLHQALRELLPASMIRHRSGCTNVCESHDAAILSFSDDSRAEFDVVVGADGIHSVVRGAIIGDAPRFSGHTVYRGVVPADRLPGLFDRPTVIFWLGPGAHVTSYPIANHKLIHFSAVVTSPGWDPTVWSARADPAAATAAFATWSDEVPELIGAADTIHRWALFDRDGTDRWSTDRITLAGDAAHPMLPYLSQGANQAIEDAAVLSGLLSTGGSDIPGALRRYTELRAPRAIRVQRGSRDRGRRFHLPDGPRQRGRDAAMAWTERLEAYHWLYGFDAGPH